MVTRADKIKNMSRELSSISNYLFNLKKAAKFKKDQGLITDAAFRVNDAKHKLEELSKRIKEKGYFTIFK